MQSRSNRTPLTTGPWTGVRDTTDPFDDDPGMLQQAQNMYLPDSQGGSGMYQRPGFTVNTSSTMITKGRGIYSHIDLTGTVYNFVVCDGFLYRVSSDFQTETDVTPVISGSDPINTTGTRVYFTSFAGQLIFSDGVHPPLILSNLSSTPVTAVKIDFDGTGTAWAAYGQPVVYGGSLFFVLDNVGGTPARTDIAWSLPADPAHGYQQTDYDYRWTLEQTSSAPIYALCATNTALFYFRSNSIGAITGTPGPDLAGASTHDAISQNLGTLQSATIQQSGLNIFFCDLYGRPWMIGTSAMQAYQGAGPTPIWLNMRAVVDRLHGASYPNISGQVSCTAIEPSTGVFLAAIWSPTTGTGESPTEISAFDVRSGKYLGQWTVGGGISIDAMGTFVDASGRTRLAILSDTVVAGNSYEKLWVQSPLYGDTAELGIEDLSAVISTEDGTPLTTENAVLDWTDNGEVPDTWILTGKLGYSDSTVINVDRCAIVTLSDSPCSVSMGSPNQAIAVEGTPTPSPSQDGTYRLVVGADIQGRGIPVKVSPTNADTQWAIEQVTIAGVVSKADILDP